MLSKILIILGIVLTLAGAGFSYVNYTKEQELKGTLAKTEGELKTTQGTLSTTQETLKTTEATLTETKGTLETTTSELTSTKGKLDAANTDLTSTKEKLASAEAVVVEKTAKVEELQGQVDKSAELAAQLAQATTDLTAARAELATAQAEVARLQGEMAAEIAKRTPAPVSGDRGAAVEPGITGKVQAVNAGWSFVVLNLGEKDGVVPNAILDVYRDSTKVGQVKVSSVEPTISTANIVETKGGTTATIEPGDRVITRS